MARMEIKEDKINMMTGKDASGVDYADLTVTDDDFAEEERDRF